MSDSGIRTCNTNIKLLLVTIFVMLHYLPAAAGTSIRLLCTHGKNEVPFRLDIDLEDKSAVLQGTKLARTYEIVNHTDAQVSLFGNYETGGGELIVLDLATGDTLGVLIGYMKSTDAPTTKLQTLDKITIGKCRKSIVE